MNKVDEFRANAEECQRMANGTKNPNDKRRWLQMAEAWLRMVKQATTGRHFDAVAHEHGADQSRFRTSH